MVDPKSLQAWDVVGKDPTEKMDMTTYADEGKALSKRLYGIVSGYSKNRLNVFYKLLPSRMD